MDEQTMSLPWPPRIMSVSNRAEHSDELCVTVCLAPALNRPDAVFTHRHLVGTVGTSRTLTMDFHIMRGARLSLSLSSFLG